LNRIMLGMLAEDVVVGSSGGLEGRVHGVENHGVAKIVTLEVDERSMKATVPAHMALELQRDPVRDEPGQAPAFFADHTGSKLGSMKEETNHD
jgi:hypothetical protein